MQLVNVARMCFFFFFELWLLYLQITKKYMPTPQPTIAFSLLHHQYLVLFLSQQTNQAPSFLHTHTATSPHGFARESVAHPPSKMTSLKPYPSTLRTKSVSIAQSGSYGFFFYQLGPQFHRTPIVTPQLHCVSGTVAPHQCPSMRKW